MQYFDDAGDLRHVSSGDVNAYLKEITGQPISAKDYRTWAATVQAAEALAPTTFASKREAKALLKSVIAQVSARLGNTPAICRKCYIHPQVQTAFLEGRFSLAPESSDIAMSLRPQEAAVLAFLQTNSTVEQAKTDAAKRRGVRQQVSRKPERAASRVVSVDVQSDS